MANSPSKSRASLELSRNADIDISPQSHDQEPNSSETHSTSLGLQQALDRGVTSSASTEKKRDAYQIPASLSTSQVKASSNSSGMRTENDNANLRMFLIRPSVQDDDETVQVSWNTTDTNVRLSEIRKQLAQYERENQPSVLDTLETLRAYEGSVIDDINEHGNFSADRSRYKLIALKRTWTNISHREMVFQGVLGLRLVVQRVPSQTQLLNRNIVESEAATEIPPLPHCSPWVTKERIKTLSDWAPEPSPFRWPMSDWKGPVEDEVAATKKLPRVERFEEPERVLPPEDETINNTEQEQVVM